MSTERREREIFVKRLAAECHPEDCHPAGPQRREIFRQLWRPLEFGLLMQKKPLGDGSEAGKSGFNQLLSNIAPSLSSSALLLFVLNLAHILGLLRYYKHPSIPLQILFILMTVLQYCYVHLFNRLFLFFFLSPLPF